MPSASTLYPNGAVFSVDIEAGARKKRYDYGPNEQHYDVAAVEFEDDGTLTDRAQLDAAADCIRNAREKNANGAVVVVFIHGWHHGAAWDVAADGTDKGGDAHFRDFRKVLRSLALREAERNAPTGKGRRVVGIYVGWNGDRKNSFFGSGWRAVFSFRNRYKVASTIGSGSDIRELIKTIVAQSKDRMQTGEGSLLPEAPLVLIGHSMGGLMLELAFLGLLTSEPESLVREDLQRAPDTVEIRREGKLVSFPDVLIALNSAADSNIAKEISARLGQMNMTKTATAEGIRYSPPLLMSVTSTADWATWLLWPAANPHRFWHKTDGHDRSLFTHGFAIELCDVKCEPRGQLDKGQNWHCLRKPEPAAAATPSIPIDLPVQERNGLKDLEVPHARYRLAPTGDPNSAFLIWVFQVGPKLIKNHNDIFNSRSSSLILALIQISGAIMSLAEDWRQSFED